jgi:hypothetical protein
MPKRLDHVITALNLLGTGIEMVPVFGVGLKKATEIATNICEMVQVRSFRFLIYFL